MSTRRNEVLTEQVKEYARKMGADIVGIAPVERFKNAPLRMSPNGLLPTAHSVIVMGVHHLDSAVELGGDPTPHDSGPYDSQFHNQNAMLDDYSFKMARYLEDRNWETLPISASNIWRYHAYKDLKVDFAPDLAHRYAAVAAGLGEIGWNNLFLTSEFGPRIRVVSVITEAELIPDPMYDGPSLCDKCMECVKNCPTDCFRKETKGITSVEIGEKTYKFHDTNKWRCAWAENFALDLNLNIPDKVNEKVVLEYMEKYGQRGGEEGSCLRYCMVPLKRYYQKDYTTAPRRKRVIQDVSPKAIIANLKQIAGKGFIDVVVLGNKKMFKSTPHVNPELHLPDVESVITVGIRISEDIERNNDAKAATTRRLQYVEFEIAHYLEKLGYSAITMTKIHDELVAAQMGLREQDTCYSTILTSAVLPEFNWKPQIQNTQLTKTEIKEFCDKQGADLVGFFNIDRFNELTNSLMEHFPEQEDYEVVDKGYRYGTFVPAIRRKKRCLKNLEEYLPKAKSVIVLGIHYPNAAVDIAKVTPAETVGPYSFAQYETVRLLRDTALDLVKFLEHNGFRGTLANDLCGLGNLTINPRGLIPGIRSSRFAAVAAGLGSIGANGLLITSKYGVRQRFICVITDIDMINDPLFTEQTPCDSCSRPCVTSCPTSAISSKSITFTLGNRKFSFPDLDEKKCEWATRYALSGKEGPDYYGLKSNTPTPDKADSQAIAAATSKVNWGVQKRLMSICEECLRTCPAKGR